MRAALASLGHDVDTVGNEGLIGAPDHEVWSGAQSAKRFFITQDLDFSDLRQFAPATHKGLLLVRMVNPGRDALVARVASVFATVAVEDWGGCFVVVTEHKVRVKRAG